jgi:hypothetical protein
MRLATYSWLTVVLGVACAAVGWLGLPGWLALAVIAASVAMHMAGNAIGTSLRDATDRSLERVPGTASPPLPPRPPAHLERRTSLGRLVPVSACIGGVCGGLAGTVALLRLASASMAGAVLGGLSSAILGGLFGFLAASFVEIVRTSVGEAIAAERQG